jgi:hypothetical protein
MRARENNFVFITIPLEKSREKDIMEKGIWQPIKYDISDRKTSALGRSNVK